MSESPGPTPQAKLRKGPKTCHILAGLILGAVAGVVANLAWGKTAALANIVRYGTEPAGQMWLRALIMVVIPLVFARLSLGVAGLGDLHKLGRVGLKTMLFFLMVTTLAAVLGLTMVNLVRPGVGLSPEARQRLLATYHQDASPVQRGSPARPIWNPDACQRGAAKSSGGRCAGRHAGRDFLLPGFRGGVGDAAVRPHQRSWWKPCEGWATS